jgi:hypothetical protein
MACSCFYSIIVCTHCLFVALAPNPMFLPSIFDGRHRFAKRHGIKTSRHSLVPGWELTCKSAPILDWPFGNNTCMGEVTKLMTFTTLTKET